MTTIEHADDIDIPPRPYLPPAFAAALSACMASAWMLEDGWNRLWTEQTCSLSVKTQLVMILFGVALSILGVVLRRKEGNRYGSYLLASGTACVICVCSCSIWLQGANARMERLSGSVSSYSFVIAGDASRGDTGVSCSARVIGETGTVKASVRLIGEDAYQRGDVLRVIGRWKPLDDSDWSRSRFMKGESSSVRIISVLDVREGASATPIERLRRPLLSSIDPATDPASALLAGVVCGYATELSQDGLRDAFARSGLSHLVAVSGSHLSVVCALSTALLGRTSMSRRKQRVIVSCLLTGYVLLTGASASAIRAACMNGCGILAAAGGRRKHGISALSLSVCAMLAIDPAYVFDIGFQLSVASLLGILLLGGYARYALSYVPLLRFTRNGLAMTLIAQLSTAPLSIPLFGQVSAIAPLANILIAPMVSALLALGVVFVPLSLAFPFLLAPLEWLGRGIIFCARLCASVPFACLPVSTDSPVPPCLVLICVVVFMSWPRLTKLLVRSVLILLLSGVFGWLIFWIQFAPTSITVLDVGQADAILLRSGSHAVLVDAGVDEDVLQALARNNVFKLDAVVVTHWDADHWGGLPYILDTYPVDRVLVAKGAKAHEPSGLRALGIEIDEIEYGDKFRVGEIACRMLWPYTNVDGEDNADSVALLAQCGKNDEGFSMLLTGDTEVDEEHEYADSAGDIDILKLGHHGSAKSVDATLLQTLRPEVAIASAGEGNSYGHPTSECTDALADRGVRFLCTIDAGDIVLTPDAGGVRVRSSKSAAGALE